MCVCAHVGVNSGISHTFALPNSENHDVSVGAKVYMCGVGSGSWGWVIGLGCA